MLLASTLTRQFARFALVALALVPDTAWAHIIRRHDVPDSAYLAYGRHFPAVGKVGLLGDATLIAPRWMVTAAHVARAASRQAPMPLVSIDGRHYAIERVVIHPSWRELGPHDMALLELSSPVEGVAPLRIARIAPLVGTTATLVGHGAAGVGNSRLRADDGLRRAATSAVDSASDVALFLSFTPPPRATALEGAPGRGDSGGPALLEGRGAWLVVGVSSAGFDGEVGPGSYGAVDVFTRVDVHADWIDDVIAGRTGEAASLVHPLPDASTEAPGDTNPVALLPATAIGERAAAFVRAMREGSDAAILGFLGQHFAPAELVARPAQVRLPNFRRLSGELRNTRVLRVRSADASAITIELHREGGAPMVLVLIAEAAPPHKLLDWRRFD